MTRPLIILFILFACMMGPALADGKVALVEIYGATPQLAQYIRQSVSKTSQRLAQWTGKTPQRIIIEVHSSHAEFSRQMAQLGAPAWADGLALPRSGIIHIKSPGMLSGVSEFDHVLAHELMHLHLAPAMGGRSLPLWLEEGLAVLLSGEPGWRRGQSMARGVLLDDLPPLSELARRFPADHAKASEAYAVAYYFASWFLDQYGDAALRRVIEGIGQGLEPTAAFRRATGVPLAKLEKQFRLTMEERFSWFGVLSDTGVIWGLMALLAALGLLAAYRRQKSRRKAMDDLDRDLLHAPPGRIWPPPARRADVLSEAGQNSEENRPAE